MPLLYPFISLAQAAGLLARLLRMPDMHRTSGPPSFKDPDRGRRRRMRRRRGP
ncbi:protein of unassigned function [Methylobacterium oryzae CBMB20]|uniref:Protein of unassigned function n=1 Tax=Methylobacterium oryzae CBMB20 TaxID=693986 RepID=A0A089NV37_9HYPH|nr:protein of unassigned function [Methylobacterium oryzae CBMB20]